MRVNALRLNNIAQIFWCLLEFYCIVLEQFVQSQVYASSLLYTHSESCSYLQTPTVIICD